MTIVPADRIPQAGPCPTDPAGLRDLYKTCLLMEEVCRRENGVGLSAVQVGIPLALYVAAPDGTFGHFVNCSYTGIGDLEASLEGCLSLRNPDGTLRFFSVPRFPSIRLSGKKLTADRGLTLESVESELSGLAAIVHQHEIDHGLKILISDIGEEMTVWPDHP